MEKLNSFTALDFETLTPERTSACAIGLVKVIDGQIVQKLYSLINPIPDNRTKDNSAIHGITREMVAKAPTFEQLWPMIDKFVGSDTIVCHNAEFDKAVWTEQLIHYACVENPYKYEFFCTYHLTGLPLDEACVKHNIDMGSHHDALDDALACAKVLLAENGFMQTRVFPGGIGLALKQYRAKKYERDTLDPIDDALVENKETPFFHARTVVTGVFEAFPNRNDLGKKLQVLGADINTTISKKTNVVVIGDGAGPSKLRKIEELRNDGFDIRIIFEPELISILS